ncbi:uncharacterized protein LOC114517969 [Dendronephthya gigantea]|uniref:uncharacterized protein LOC114517969 n=1 Tax=Dendronephthya gigantea TaxID=151771 RepID=UPI00106BE303|nr:uncharacterized protein LOC114517969 [Dendronephthya gigantea]
MMAKLCLGLQVVVSLAICICRGGDADTALEDRNRASEITTSQLANFALDEQTVFKFPVIDRDGNIEYEDISKEISIYQSEEFGRQLLGMEMYDDVEKIRTEQNPQSSIKRIIKLWFEGGTENPVTCRFLAEVLRNIGLINRSDDIRTTCEHVNVLDEPYRPRTLKRYYKQLSEIYEREPVFETTLFLPKKLRELKISYVDLEMEEKGATVSLSEFLDSVQEGNRVLFLGRPGVGKTTVTRYMTKILLHDRRFYLVVKIHLRDSLKRIDSLVELLKVCRDESFQSDSIKRISKYIETKVGAGVIFLLDGYDDYHEPSNYIHDLLKKISLKKAIVILTSRPTAVENITGYFDRQVEIIGFGSASIRSYLEQIKLPEAKRRIINHYLSIYQNVRQSCYLPLHLSMQNEERYTENTSSLRNCLYDVDSETNLCIIFRKIYQLSFEGLMPGMRKNALVSTSFNELPANLNISAKLEEFSLFKVVPIDDSDGARLYKYYYSHPTFQELFAALHLTTLPRNERLSYAQHTSMYEVYKFFLGIIGNKNAKNYDSEYLSRTFVSFTVESVYRNHKLYMIKCAHQPGQNFVPLLKAAGVITESNSLTLDVNALMEQDCWYIGHVLLRSPLYKLDIEALVSEKIASCISVIEDYFKLYEHEILDIVDVKHLAVGPKITWLSLTAVREDAGVMTVMSVMNFLSVFEKRLKHLELSFMTFKNNKSVLLLADTLKSFGNLTSLVLLVHVDVIRDGVLEMALKNLPSLNHLKLGVVFNGLNNIPGNLQFQFRNMRNIKSLTLVLIGNIPGSVNMTSLFGELRYLTNLQSLSIICRICRFHNATEMLQGIKRVAVPELALELNFFSNLRYDGFGIVSVINNKINDTGLELLAKAIETGYPGTTTDVPQHVISSNALAALTTSTSSASFLWKLRTSLGTDLDGTGTNIAILDSAVDCQYATLLGKQITSIDCFLPTLSNRFDEHGTLCASIAIGSAAQIDETTFIHEGVAPGAACFAYRVTEGNRCFSEAVLKALDDIKMKILHEHIQIDVVSISLDITENQDEIEKKILSLTEKKVVFVAAAGNLGEYAVESCFPARLKSVISVGARDRCGRESKFNSCGHIDVYAIGEDIPLAVTTETTEKTQTKAKTATTARAGTSFATPAIAGLVLLLKQLANRIGPPACDHIHNVEILRRIFDEDMRVTSGSGKVLHAPGVFLERVTSRPDELNEIVRRHLRTLGEGAMETG